MAASKKSSSQGTIGWQDPVTKKWVFGAEAAKHLLDGTNIANPAAPTKGLDPAANKAALAGTTAPSTTTTTPPRVDPFYTPDDINQMAEWMRTVGDNRATAESTFSGAKTDSAFQTGQLSTQAAQAGSTADDNMESRGLFQSSVKDAALFDIEAQRAQQQGLLNDRLTQATTDHDTWVSRYGGTMSDGTVVPVGTEVDKFQQDWAGKAAANAQAVNDSLVPSTTTTPGVAPVNVPGQSTTAFQAHINAPDTAGAPNNKPPVPANQSGTVNANVNTPGVAAPTGGGGPAFTVVPGVDPQTGAPGVWHVYPDHKVFVKQTSGVQTP